MPVSPATTTTTIDNVPINGGLLNGQPKLTFDRDGQPLIAYHKYDTGGRSQIYLARPATGTQSWRIVPLTTSIRRWEFSGGGTLPPGGSGTNSFLADDPLDGLTTVSTNIVGYIPPLDENPNQSLAPDESNGLYVIDETTLTTIVPKSPLMYSAVHQPICASNFVDNGALQFPNYTHAGASMGIMRSVSTGAPLAGQHYYLRWDALPANRDAARLVNGVEILPPAVDLRVYRTACNYPASQPGTQVQPTKDAAEKPVGFMFKPSAATVTGSISRHEEAGRVFGDYLQSDATYAPNSHYASWTFTVPAGQGGDYVLGGSTYSKTATDDSFVIELDGVLLEWFLMSRNRWHYQPVTIGASRSLTRFSLEAGRTYTLRLHAREKDAKLEYLWLTPTNRGNKIPTITSLDETSYTLASDGTAVSGHWLAPDPTRPATDFMAHYSLPIPVKGCYTLLGRTKASGGSGFHLSLKHPTDAAYRARNVWTVPQSGNDWTWRPAVDGTPLLLDPGNLDVKVEGMDYGTKLDAFMLLYKKPNSYGVCE